MVIKFLLLPFDFFPLTFDNLLASTLQQFPTFSDAGLPEFQRPPVNLTLDTISTTSAVLKWFTSNRSLDVAMSSRLSVHRMSRGHTRHRQGEMFALVDAGVTVTAGDVSGWCRLDDLEPDTSYSAQLVTGHMDIVDGVFRNVSNAVYFSTLLEGRRPFTWCRRSGSRSTPDDCRYETPCCTN
jgi:hypothetical protein